MCFERHKQSVLYYHEKGVLTRCPQWLKGFLIRIPLFLNLFTYRYEKHLSNLPCFSIGQKVIEQQDKIKAAYDLLSDGQSKKVFSGL